ncbi:TonB-dependent receptor [Compostibacter hankyongensis]|uniref:TonB-dependent receptor n=1 Tax=Compostibacter hankyongensis TaxID=1007089 RepID=A0ABP8FVH3_9BACT
MMKLTVLFLTLGFMQVTAAGYSQERISISLENVAIKVVLRTIQHNSHYRLIYNDDILPGDKKVSLSLKNAALEDVMRQTLSGTDLTYRLLDKKMVVVTRKPGKEPETPFIRYGKKMLSLNKEIRGTVTDSTGAPLPGVTVSVKNDPTVATSTDLNGKYILDVPDQATVVFRMVGFDPQEIPVNRQEIINITLRPSSNQLNDVVVVAFGTQKKQEVVGAMTTINPAELKVPASNLTTALAGRLAGVIAYQRSGEPGADNADFFIRGVTTFGYKKDPLILIDGIELSSTDLARLQVDDIASFSIMKDATATALYGARGANGVILITTKEGVEGKAKVSVRIENSVSAPTKNVEFADPVTYMNLANEAVLTRDALGVLLYPQSKIDNTLAGTNPYAYPATDWRSELFKDYTMNQRVNFNVNGGGKVARYYLAATLNQDHGVLKVDKRNNFNSNINLKTYELRSNVNINLTKSTEVGIKLYGTFDDYTGPINGGTDMYKKVMRANPVLFPAYFPMDDAHAFVQHIMFGNYADGNYLNPYADMVKGYKDYTKTLVLAQFELKQDLSFLAKGLTLNGIFNTTRQSYFGVARAYKPFWYQVGGYDKVKDAYNLTLLNENDGTDYLDYAEDPKQVNSTTYIQASVNYNRTFGDKHNISDMLVFLLNNQVQANVSSLQASLPHRNIGVSGRFTYSYDNRYFGEFDFGYNGSERFYKDKRFGFFPSVGAAWYVSNEPFWESYKQVVSNLKIRATYGLVGNDAIGDPQDRFFYLSDVNMDDAGRASVFGTDNGYSRNGISVNRYGNSSITWETATKTNLGIELGLWDKVNVQLDLYREHRKNILMTRSYIPITIGVLNTADIKANIGQAVGKGIDLSVDYNQYIGQHFWIQGRANFTYATSAYKVYEEPDYTEKYLYHTGWSLSQQWGYIAERLFADDAEVANSPLQSFGEYSAGDIKYRDVNGDGQVTTLDQVPIGYPTTPEIVYGFGFSVGYKAFDLSCFFQGLGRESFWIDPKATAPFVAYRYSDDELPGITLQNQLLKAYADNHWSEDNRNLYALWPRLSTRTINNNTQTSTWFMRNGSFLRLKTVEFGYTLPQRLTERIHVEKARFYLSGINLLCFSRFKLWDVEMGGNGLGYPVQRVTNIGVQVSF